MERPREIENEKKNIAEKLNTRTTTAISINTVFE